jgi:hypothetical protein
LQPSPEVPVRTSAAAWLADAETKATDPAARASAAEWLAEAEMAAASPPLPMAPKLPTPGRVSAGVVTLETTGRLDELLRMDTVSGAPAPPVLPSTSSLAPIEGNESQAGREARELARFSFTEAGSSPFFHVVE